MIWITLFFSAVGVNSLLMLLLWFMHLVKNDPDRIDLFWGIGSLIAGLIFLCHDEITPPRLYVASLLGFWAGRLSAYLWLIGPLRHRPGRLTRLLENKKYKNTVLFFIYQFQGFAMTLIALPCLFMGRNEMAMSLVQFAFGTFILFMIILQSIADTELYEHLSAKREAIYELNLWRFCRHPNYFFEGAVLLGFTMMASTTFMGWMAILAPISYYLLARFYWLPLSEGRLVKEYQEAYSAYQADTYAFFFKFPNKPKSD